MHDAVPVQQVESEPLGLVPGMPPRCSTGPTLGLARPASPSTFRPRWHISPVDSQHQDRATKAPRFDLGYSPLHLVTRRGHIQHAEPLSHLIGERMHPLTAHVNATG